MSTVATKLCDWTDDELAMALLSDLWRLIDAGGRSHGRGRDGATIEAVQTIFLRMGYKRPRGDVDQMPLIDDLLLEARRRELDAICSAPALTRGERE